MHDSLEPVPIPLSLDTQPAIPHVVQVDMDSCTQPTYTHADDGSAPSYTTLI